MKRFVVIAGAFAAFMPGDVERTVPLPLLNRTTSPFKLEHVYYINLDSRPDRRDEFEKEFRQHGINVTRFPAVGIADVSNRTEDCWLFGGSKSRCQGSYACLMSHHEVLNLAIEQNLPHVAVFEDDFSFSEPWVKQGNVKQLLEEAVSSLDVDWDVIGLGHTMIEADALCTEPAGKFRPIKINRARMASGYIVNRRFLKTLRDVISPEYCPVAKDRLNLLDQCWEGLQKSNNWFAFDPQPGIQRKSFSNIDGIGRDLSNITYWGSAFDVPRDTYCYCHGGNGIALRNHSMSAGYCAVGKAWSGLVDGLAAAVLKHGLTNWLP